MVRQRSQQEQKSPKPLGLNVAGMFWNLKASVVGTKKGKVDLS